VDGHVRMGIANQLRTIDENFRIVASFPELKKTPIAIGESDPDGCAACQGPQLGYRNTTVFSSYTAAAFARKHDLAARHGVNLLGALTWAFEFEGQPYFAGFRVLATNGIDLPVLNVFRMFAKMPGTRVAAESDGMASLDAILRSGVRDKPDVGVLASRGDGKLAILLWHYHDDDVPGPAADVTVTVTGLPASVKVTPFRIDAETTNPFAAWKKMGSPKEPTREQYAVLEKAGRLGPAGEAETATGLAGTARLPVSLPRQAVVLLVLEWPAK